MGHFGDRSILHLVARPDVDLPSALAGLDGVTASARDPACFMRGTSPQAGAVESTDGSLLIEIARTLGPLIDAEQSMAITGTDHVFIAAPEPTPVRYQYLMHRRSDFTHEQYLERYGTVHKEFGLRTPNIDGYVQLHVDLAASRSLAVATGLRAEPCDSMSELHLRSVAHFLDGILAHPEVGAEAQEDEERFVDRDRSFGFAHRVV
jgi:hypothetical protein